MSQDQKNQDHINLDSLKFLVSTLVEKGLKNLSITGGEPTLYPKLKELLAFLSPLPLKNKFFHTNGIELSEALAHSGLKNFTKIAVTIHTVDQKNWQKVTGGTGLQFKKLQRNLKSLSKIKPGPQIEIKHIAIRGFNDSQEILRGFLDYCAENNFKFKFLNFEPITKDQLKLVISFREMRRKLESLGCKYLELEGSFRGQTDYLPIFCYQYKNTRGVVIEIGCGDPRVCKACFNSNEIFIMPTLKIKPCHMSPEMIPLAKIIKNKDKTSLCEAIVESRGILKSMPGENKNYWQELS